MRSIPLLLTSLLAIASATGICEASKRPNVILIMTDDQGYGDLGCHGNPVLATPHLDRLYGECVRLTNFYGMIANIDENVGRLRQRLEEMGLADNTLLIFMTDNGTARGITFTDYRGNEGRRVSGYNAGMRGRKGSPYEGGHRAPCFFHWPAGGLTSPRDIDRLTAHLDMLPTLIDLCGLAAPEGVRFDGRSLAPLLLDPDYRLRDRILCAHHQEVPRPEKFRFGCVMDGKWRLVIRNDDRETPTFELFDLSADPGQTTDVSAAHEEMTRRLRSAYDTWWNDVDERMDDYSRIVVGDPRQNPVRLTCFDWHSVQRWGQGSVRSGKKENGFWALDVAEAGDYEIVLWRWPEEVNQPITAAIPKGKAITADEAHLRIGTVSKSQSILEGAATVTFRVSLPEGSTQMEASLTDHGRELCGAYYASVRKRP